MILDERFVRHLLQVPATDYATYLATLSPEDRCAVEQAVRKAAHLHHGVPLPREVIVSRLKQRVACCVAAQRHAIHQKADQPDARSQQGLSETGAE